MAMDQARRTIVALAVLLGQGATGHSALLADGSASGLLRSSGEVAPGKPMVVVVPPRSASRILSVVVSISEPGSLSADAMLDCRVEEDGHGARCLLTKRLDLCDADLAGIVQQVAGTTLRIRVSRVGHVDPVGASDGDIRLAVSVADLGPADALRGGARSTSRSSRTTRPKRPTSSCWAARSMAWPTIAPTGPPRSRQPATSSARESTGSGSSSTARLRGWPISPSTTSIATCRPTCASSSGRMGGWWNTPGASTPRASSASGRRVRRQQVHHPRARARDLLSPGGCLPARLPDPDEALRRAALHPPRRGPDRDARKPSPRRPARPCARPWTSSSWRAIAGMPTRRARGIRPTAWPISTRRRPPASAATRRISRPSRPWRPSRPATGSSSHSPCSSWSNAWRITPSRSTDIPASSGPG